MSRRLDIGIARTVLYSERREGCLIEHTTTVLLEKRMAFAEAVMDIKHIMNSIRRDLEIEQFKRDLSI